MDGRPNLAACDFGRFGMRLMKNTHNLGFKFRKFESEDGSAWMEDQIAALRQQLHMAAQRLSHPALDAIAFVGFTQNLADGKANARS